MVSACSSASPEGFQVCCCGRGKGVYINKWVIFSFFEFFEISVEGFWVHCRVCGKPVGSRLEIKLKIFGYKSISLCFRFIWCSLYWRLLW